MTLLYETDCCYTCVFSRHYDNDARECHRYPPQLCTEFRPFSGIFPRVNNDEWCGEYVRLK
jgi:hypothetical protein